MVKSKAQCQKDYRKKSVDYQERERERAKKNRASFTDEEKSRKREQGRLRMQKCRARKMDSKSKLCTPYMTKGSETRAVNRVMEKINATLPTSPSKCAFVKSTVGKHLLGISSSSKQIVHRKTSLPSEVKKHIIQFYELDDISRMSPGKRDFVKVDHLYIQKVNNKMISLICFASNYL
jgi:uncharacterized cysteine cluster protein YcgN (CxxCxxCC family)